MRIVIYLFIYLYIVTGIFSCLELIFLLTALSNQAGAAKMVQLCPLEDQICIAAAPRQFRMATLIPCCFLLSNQPDIS